MSKRILLPLTITIVLACCVPRVEARRSPTTEWDPQIEKIGEKLVQHDWKAARRLASKLARRVVEQSWHQPGLNRTLASIARSQAIAEINLNRDREAVWHWHLAWNLSLPSDQARAGLADLGRASVLLEYPLRQRRKLPQGYTPLGPLESLEVEPPKVTIDGGPRLRNSSGLNAGLTPDLQVEVLVDRQGHLSYPVVDDTGVHPVIVYVAIDWLFDHASVQPARRNGQPVEYLQDFTIAFLHQRGL